MTTNKMKAELEAAGCQFVEPLEYGALAEIVMPDGLRLVYDYDDNDTCIRQAYAHLQEKRKLDAYEDARAYVSQAYALATRGVWSDKNYGHIVDLLRGALKTHPDITDESDDDG